MYLPKTRMSRPLLEFGGGSGALVDQRLLDGAPPQWIGLGHRLEGRERHLLPPRADPGAADR